MWRPQCTPVYLCTYWCCTDFLSHNLIPLEDSRTERRILKESCCALWISVWNNLHFHSVLFEIVSYFPTAGQSHSDYYKLTLTFHILAHKQIFWKEVVTLNLETWNVDIQLFIFLGNVYLTKNYFAEVLRSIQTTIPYENFRCAHDFWWKKVFHILCL